MQQRKALKMDVMAMYQYAHPLDGQQLSLDGQMEFQQRHLLSVRYGYPPLNPKCTYKYQHELPSTNTCISYRRRVQSYTKARRNINLIPYMYIIVPIYTYICYVHISHCVSHSEFSPYKNSPLLHVTRVSKGL